MSNFKEGDIISFKDKPYTVMLVFMDMYVCSPLSDTTATMGDVVEEMFVHDGNRFEYLDDLMNIELYDYGFKTMLEDIAKEE
jgi:hypothetical protein